MNIFLLVKDLNLFLSYMFSPKYENNPIRYKKVSSFKSRENIQKKNMGQILQFRILNSLQ